MKIAVAGATGRLGRHVADVLTERGHRVVPMSRATGVDIIESPAGPAGIIEVAGAREENLVELASMLVARRGMPVTVQGVRKPADPDAELQANGGLLPGPGARLAGPTFAEWLDLVGPPSRR